jgi:secondary thiamine-phosphate synthase enzyme
MIRSATLTLESEEETQFLDITDRVEKVLKELGTRGEGAVSLFTRHTTTALLINEGEAGLLEDYRTLFESLIPRGRGYRHDRIDDNAHAHLRSLLLGSGLLVPFREGKLQLGTWQRIFFVELDGPRRRVLHLQVID